jgi:hypothetical protein
VRVSSIDWQKAGFTAMAAMRMGGSGIKPQASVSSLGFNPFDAAAWHAQENWVHPDRKGGKTSAGGRAFKAKWKFPLAATPTTAEAAAQAAAAIETPSVIETFEFTLAEFQAVRQAVTVNEALDQLDGIAVDLELLAPADFTKKLAKTCFITCNSYTNPELSLGAGPLNDAITVAANHRLLGFNVYFMHNGTNKRYLEWLKAFMKVTTETMVTYYSGHGSQRSGSRTEADGFDEILVFDGKPYTYVVDDEIATCLKASANGKLKIITLFDCCHSGSMTDIPDTPAQAEKEGWPANIISISAAKDEQTSKQGTGFANTKAEQGIWTFNFFALIRESPGISPAQVQAKINLAIAKFDQNCEVRATRAALLTDALYL